MVCGRRAEGIEGRSTTGLSRKSAGLSRSQCDLAAAVRDRVGSGGRPTATNTPRGETWDNVSVHRRDRLHARWGAERRRARGSSVTNKPPRVAPPRRVDAELVERRMGSGRNQPVLIYARDFDDRPLQCVVKSRSRLPLQPSEYLAEWVGATLARELGLNTPEPLGVVVTSEFARATGQDFRSEMLASVGLVYGSRFVRPFTQMPFGYALTSSQREIAAQVLAFDVFIHNSDRRAINHNMFIDRNDIVVFDHELAFDFVLPLIGAADPALDHCAGIVGHHVFFSALRRNPPNSDGFRAVLSRLDDNFFAELEAATPVEWTVDQARGKLGKIVEVLRKRRDAVDHWLPKVFACLDR
jgi:hypothetical protein